MNKTLRKAKRSNAKFKQILNFLFAISPAILFAACASPTVEQNKTSAAGQEEIFAGLTVDPQKSSVEFFFDDEDGKIFQSFENVKNYVEKSGRKLRFAMNGGMYREDRKPVGLFIRDGKTLMPLNTRTASGNFYLKPNGVFAVRRDNRAFLTTTENFKDDGQIKFATQSGPMLIIDGNINPQFIEKSDNLNIRNGVCVLDDGKILFAISRKEVNFYDLAVYFKNAGCRNALYLDGFVSKMYLPEKNINDLGGEFGVIIAVVK